MDSDGQRPIIRLLLHVELPAGRRSGGENRACRSYSSPGPTRRWPPADRQNPLAVEADDLPRPAPPVRGPTAPRKPTSSARFWYSHRRCCTRDSASLTAAGARRSCIDGTFICTPIAGRMSSGMKASYLAVTRGPGNTPCGPARSWPPRPACGRARAIQSRAAPRGGGLQTSTAGRPSGIASRAGGGGSGLSGRTVQERIDPRDRQRGGRGPVPCARL